MENWGPEKSLVSQGSQKPTSLPLKQHAGDCRAPGALRTRPNPSANSLLPRAGASPEQPPRAPVANPASCSPHLIPSPTRGTGRSHSPSPASASVSRFPSTQHCPGPQETLQKCLTVQQKVRGRGHPGLRSCTRALAAVWDRTGSLLLPAGAEKWLHPPRRALGG